MIFLNKDILEIIFIKLPIRERIEFIKTNKFFYENFKKEIQKYKLILYANKDYVNFYHTLNDYKYEDYYEKLYMDKIIARCFMYIPNVWQSRVCCLYDMRFIFELMFKGYDPGEGVKKYKSHFYIHFYKRIKDCISEDREETLEKIEKDSYLFSLKKNPKFRTDRNGKDFQWHSLIRPSP